MPISKRGRSVETGVSWESFWTRGFQATRQVTSVPGAPLIYVQIKAHELTKDSTELRQRKGQENLVFPFVPAVG